MGSKEPQPAPIGPKPKPPPPPPTSDVMDAADAFLAEPPGDMQDSRPFNQYTTAGDCRRLNKAYHEACEGGD